MRECVTHHYACDCREEKFRKLEAESEKLKKAIEYSRQHYHLPQAVYDVFSKLVPNYVPFTRDEVEVSIR